MDIPEGQNQSGWWGFNKELILLLHPITVVNKERKGYTNSAEENTQKRIPAKERLGPTVSYADSLRIPMIDKQTAKGEPLTAHVPILKFSKPSEITHNKDMVYEKKEGKVKFQAKFLGVNPYRRRGTDTASQNLKISVSVEGKRSVTWDRQAPQVAKAGLSTQSLGLAVSKPNKLVRVEVEDLFSGPSQFEWGESSNMVNKPKQVWVAKKKGADKVDGGPFKANFTARCIDNTNDAVEALDISRMFVGLTPLVHVFMQELKFLMCWSTREGEYQQFRVEYCVGINLSVPRSIVGD